MMSGQRERVLPGPMPGLSVLEVLPSAADSLVEVLLLDDPAREIASKNLRVDLNLRVGPVLIGESGRSVSGRWRVTRERGDRSARDELGGDVVALEDRDARLDDRIVLHVALQKAKRGEGSIFHLSRQPSSPRTEGRTIEIMLSIFFIPSQWRTSGMSAWKRMSLTPAMSSVDLK
jgi:hypothetical protein